MNQIWKYQRNANKRNGDLVWERVFILFGIWRLEAVGLLDQAQCANMRFPGFLSSADDAWRRLVGLVALRRKFAWITSGHWTPSTWLLVLSISHVSGHLKFIYKSRFNCTSGAVPNWVPFRIPGSPRGPFCGFGSPLGLLFCLKVPFFLHFRLKNA